MNPETRLRTLYLATDADARASGRDWYPAARRECRSLHRDFAHSHGLTEHRAAGVIAALSPRVRWSLNLRAASELLVDGHTRTAFGSNVAKARRIIDGERPLDVLSGPKVRAFYRAILGDHLSVCIDTWAARAAGLPAPANAAQFHRVAYVYHAAAAQCGVSSPRDFQAIVWGAIRGSFD